MTGTPQIVIESPAIVQDERQLVAQAVAARGTGEKASWLEADSYLELAIRGWTQQEIADACKTTQSRVSKFMSCCGKYSDRNNRPYFFDAYNEVNGEKKSAHVSHNSGNNEWYTPAPLIEAARAVMGSIDTDPASSELANRTVKAATYFDEAANGLKQEWRGNVWMNPPYKQPAIGDFCDAVVEKYGSGECEQACVLVNNGTETAWFQTLLSEASAVCFPRTRVRFLDTEGNPSGAPLQGQAVVYLGSFVEAFAARFAEFGKVLHG